jgi:hypothetical protein
MLCGACRDLRWGGNRHNLGADSAGMLHRGRCLHLAHPSRY